METKWGKLATIVRERRERLGLTQQQVASRGGPSTATQRQLERTLSGTYRAQTFHDLDKALGWLPGTSRSLLHGTSMIGGVPFDTWANGLIDDPDRYLQGVGPSDDAAPFVGHGEGGVRDLSDLSLAQLAEYQREIADEMARRIRERG
jgi:transcriptional regulator with XRE-family HTH domain